MIFQMSLKLNTHYYRATYFNLIFQKKFNIQVNSIHFECFNLKLPNTYAHQQNGLMTFIYIHKIFHILTHNNHVRFN